MMDGMVEGRPKAEQVDGAELAEEDR